MRPDDFNILAHATTILFPREATKAMAELRQDEERPAAKAHHEASTRVVNGKVVQVSAYDDSRRALAASRRAAPYGAGRIMVMTTKGTPRFMDVNTHDVSELAHQATDYATGRGRDAHAAAELLHQKAADDHENASFATHSRTPSDLQHHAQAVAHHRKAAEYHQNMSLFGTPTLRKQDENKEWEGYPDEKRVREHRARITSAFMDIKGESKK